MDYPAMLEEEDCPKPDSSSTITWKSTLAQLLAGAAVCFTTMSIGMIMAFPTVALGELRQPNKEFSLNENEASWFGEYLLYTSLMERGRSIGVGMAGASSYVISFSLSKSFYTLNGLLGLSGCFLFYGSCGLLCVVYIYFQLPETEGKTLAEIDEYFLKTRRKPNLDVT